MRILPALLVLFLSALASAVVVDKFYKSEDGSTYFIEGEQKYNWFEAWHECQRKDMSLLAIDSFEKHQQIDKLIKKIFPVCPSLWLALNDLAVDKQFVWMTSGQPLGFSNWGSGQPNNGAEHCVFILEKTWEWHDVTCAAKSGFICEERLKIKRDAEQKPLQDTQNCCDNERSAMSKYHSIIFNRR